MTMRLRLGAAMTLLCTLSACGMIVSEPPSSLDVQHSRRMPAMNPHPGMPPQTMQAASPMAPSPIMPPMSSASSSSSMPMPAQSRAMAGQMRGHSPSARLTAIPAPVAASFPDAMSPQEFPPGTVGGASASPRPAAPTYAPSSASMPVASMPPMQARASGRVEDAHLQQAEFPDIPPDISTIRPLTDAPAAVNRSASAIPSTAPSTPVFLNRSAPAPLPSSHAQPAHHMAPTMPATPSAQLPRTPPQRSRAAPWLDGRVQQAPPVMPSQPTEVARELSPVASAAPVPPLRRVVSASSPSPVSSAPSALPRAELPPVSSQAAPVTEKTNSRSGLSGFFDFRKGPLFGNDEFPALSATPEAPPPMTADQYQREVSAMQQWQDPRFRQPPPGNWQLPSSATFAAAPPAPAPPKTPAPSVPAYDAAAAEPPLPYAASSPSVSPPQAMPVYEPFDPSHVPDGGAVQSLGQVRAPASPPANAMPYQPRDTALAPVQPLPPAIETAALPSVDDERSWEGAAAPTPLDTVMVNSAPYHGYDGATSEVVPQDVLHRQAAMDRQRDRLRVRRDNDVSRAEEGYLPESRYNARRTADRSLR